MKLVSPEYTAVIDQGLPAPIAADDEHETVAPLRTDGSRAQEDRCVA